MDLTIRVACSQCGAQGTMSSTNPKEHTLQRFTYIEGKVLCHECHVGKPGAGAKEGAY